MIMIGASVKARARKRSMWRVDSSAQWMSSMITTSGPCSLARSHSMATASNSWSRKDSAAGGCPVEDLIWAIPRYEIMQGTNNRSVRQAVPTQRHALSGDHLRLTITHPAIQIAQERLDHRGLAGPRIAAQDDKSAAVGDDVVQHAEELGALLDTADDHLVSPAAIRAGRAGHKHYRATDVRLFTAIAAQQGTGWPGTVAPEGAGRFAAGATRVRRRRRHHIGRSPRADAARRLLAASAHRSCWRCSARILYV